MTEQDVDVLIIGAGLSGIGAAWHLTKHCRDRSFTLFEGRDALGGTWDLFRYPGVRSDSDMFTLGYSFRPWTQAKAIADGPAILSYLQDTARECGIEPRIRYGHQVQSADWSSAESKWTVRALRKSDQQVVTVRCNFLFACSGYYSYAAGYMPEFPGMDQFKGRVVHPQQWPQDLDYTGKNVVVIGSGATAVTIVPEMAKLARHVTMLQRSPTYMLARPSVDVISTFLRKALPERVAYALTRAKNVLLGMYVFSLCKRKPAKVAAYFINEVKKAVGPKVDVATHFTPRYNPWEQRLCLVPDGDMFQALKAGRASVVTDHIVRFSATGLALRSGATLEADIIISATGLQLQPGGSFALSVDGKPQDSAQTVNYKGVMYCGVPNLAATFGYTNASWTLKADLTSRYVCRLLNHMRQTGAKQCWPQLQDAALPLLPWVDFSSGYFQRVIDHMPKQGSTRPWKLNQNYLLDVMALRFGRVDDGVLGFVS